MFCTPNKATMCVWRRVCTRTPFSASTSTTAASAVEAPVAMLRVYCSWPGQSATMNLRLRRLEVAIRHVDGDALLALGLQAVDQQREIRHFAGGAPAAAVVGHAPRAGRRTPGACRAAGGRSACSCRRRREPQVMKRSRSISRCCARNCSSVRWPSRSWPRAWSRSRPSRSNPRVCGSPSRRRNRHRWRGSGARRSWCAASLR